MPVTNRSIFVSAAFAISLIAEGGSALAADPVAKDPTTKDPVTKDSCVTSYENAQRLRQSGQLRAAKAQLAVCENPTCASFMRDDCTKWDAEIADAMPTVVIGAKDENGHDTTAVRVIVDDVVVADSLDGRPIPVDPGQHRVRYESGGHANDDTFVIRQGEKNRQLSTSFAPVAPAETPSGHRKIPTISWILGGVAVAGVASFTTFAILGKAKEGCAPFCSQSNVSTLRRDYLIADISLGVGIVAGVAAVYFALTAKPEATLSAQAPKAATISFEPDVTPHGADFSVRARF